MTKDLRINADRMLATFNQLALIGATAEGGVNRPTFSEAHLAACKWFREEVEQAGLEFRTDGAGNHSALLAFDHSNLPTLLLGSHLDSVPGWRTFRWRAWCGRRARSVENRQGKRDQAQSES